MESASSTSDHHRLSVLSEDAPKRIRNFANGSGGFDSLEDAWHEVCTRAGCFFDRFERSFPGLLIAAGPHRAYALHLFAFEGLVGLEDGNWLFLVNGKLIYAHNCSLPTFHLLLVFVGGVLDFLLYIAALEGTDHPAECVNLFKIRRRASFDFIGKSLHKVRASQRIDGLRRARFICDDLLGAQRDACRLLGRQRKRLII